MCVPKTYVEIGDKCALRSEDLFELGVACEFRNKQTQLIGDFCWKIHLCPANSVLGSKGYFYGLFQMLDTYFPSCILAITSVKKRRFLEICSYS
jgi:hypothetical protein